MEEFIIFITKFWSDNINPWFKTWVQIKKSDFPCLNYEDWAVGFQIYMLWLKLIAMWLVLTDWELILEEIQEDPLGGEGGPPFCFWLES